MSVSQITPKLYLSGLDAALNPSVVSSRNITLIVNASGLESMSYPHPDTVQVLPVPVQDKPHAALSHYFDLVAQQIDRNQSGKTLVHCTAGRSRSPSLIMAYLMRYEGATLRQAHELVLQQRPYIRPNAGFWRQLLAYERTLFGSNTLRMVSTSAGVLPEVVEHDKDTTAYCVNI
ncbi:dual specificity protein phosphatase 18 [Genypterus blacodes]|uniref:dual specificity protein phosphatase 18 n=1 Tax=Genypterus blacodes TaxID=154954 RepID=UPI003F768A0E